MAEPPKRLYAGHKSYHAILESRLSYVPEFDFVGDGLRDSADPYE